MAGLYIHIPFCASRCIYCGFYSTTALRQRQRYVDALCKEMELRLRHRQGKEEIETIYLGGGTPSQLTPAQLSQLLGTVSIYNKVRTDAEITIEANPDDISVLYASTLPQLGINRVSMGVQTFDDQRLHFLHRRHTAGQVPVAIQRLRDAGIRNISIDLMYGFPKETLTDWEHDIGQALALQVEHLSAYCLMVEEGTPLHQMGVQPADEETERQMYELLMDKLTEAGYEHYELSNFARPGYRSKHNSSYWQDIPYVGLGAAAHSYDGKDRSWNIADIEAYMEAIEHGERPSEQEVLDEDTHYNDRITVALRTREGLDIDTLLERHRTYCLQEAQRFLDDGLLALNGTRLSLTRQGLFVSDYIMSALIYLND